jgi:hypothetical protein
MNMQRLHFLLLGTLTAAAVTAASAQTAVVSDKQSAVSVPDFSGKWSRQSIGFEPPLSGPGPVLNKSRIRSGQANLAQLIGDYSNPILKPNAAEVVKKQGELSLAGVTFPDPRNQCRPEPLPYIFWNFEIELLQQPDKVTILYWFDHQVRRVRMNQPHRSPVTPSWYGDSVGHYEGDTLVIDTVGIKVGPFAMADMFGTPYTDALHVVERYRLLDYEAAKAAQERGEKENLRLASDRAIGDGIAVDPDYRGKGLQLEFFVEDEGVFTTPWSATVTYLRGLGEWPDMVCAENRHVYYAPADTLVPTADKPDF